MAKMESTIYREVSDSVARNIQSQKGSTVSSLKKTTDKMNWRSILLIQFQTQFIFVILLGIFVSYYIVMYEVAQAISVMRNEVLLTRYMTDTKSVIYAFDAFYVTDVSFMIIYKNTKWPYLRHCYIPRNTLILSVEAFTLIPIDAIYYNIAPVKKPSVVAILRLRYVLRLIRLYSHYKIPRSITREASRASFCLNFFVVITMISGTIGVTVQAYICKLECFANTTDVFFYNLYVATEKITGKGFGEVNYHNKLERNSFIQYALTLCSLCYYIIFAYVTAKVISAFCPIYRKVYTFLIRYTGIQCVLYEWKYKLAQHWTIYEDSLCTTIKTYYGMIWEKKKWKFHLLRNDYVLPHVMFKDLQLDASWDALKHSHLFKNKEVYFLREVASRMQHTSYARGEIIYSRNRRKARMIYINTGIVQIFSEENGDAPIISFSGGTCLGEACLLLDYPSSWTVVCKTYCEIAYLRRTDFITISHTYPFVVREMRRDIMKRYEVAKYLKRVYDFQWSMRNITNPETITLRWLKTTLHGLLENDYRDRVRLSESLTFYPDYLDLLVITEDLELVTDQIFLKKQFPPIFQPNSIFLEGWKIFMAIISLVILIGFPCYMLFCSELAGATHAMMYMIVTFFGCADIFIQSITAVRTKDFLFSNISSIIYYRLTHVAFIVDIVFCIPFSVFIIIMTNQVRYETLVLSECHKLLKAYKISYIFSKLETLSLTNKVALNYVKVFVCDFFLFYYTGIIFYYIICGGGVCSDAYVDSFRSDVESNPWYIFLHMYTLAALFMGNMNYIDFLQILEYAWIPVVVFLQFFYVFMTIYILAFASVVETSIQSKRYQYKELVSTMHTMLTDFKVDPVLQRRATSYLKDQFWIDKGLGVLIPDLFKSSMSPNLFSITEQTLHKSFLKGTSLFIGCDELLLRDASRRLKLSFYPVGDIVSYPGQVSKEIHMIQFGFCQIYGTKQILNPGDSFCLLETCLQIPTFHTVVTVTDCKICSMSYDDYRQLTVRFPDFKESVTAALRVMADDKLPPIEVTYHSWEYKVMKQKAKVPIARVFNVKKLRDRKNNLNSRWRAIYIYLLLPFTFPPNGKFIYYWEICRLIFTFATSILSGFASISQNSVLYYLLFMLDVSSWADLYIRLHVCYFNNINIEVSHPAETAKHYVQNGFLVDFIAAAPLDYIGINAQKHYLRINRILQFHRFFNFIRYINSVNISRSKLYDIVKYIALSILVLNIFGNVGYYLCCEVASNNAQGCLVNEWVILHLNKSSTSTDIKHRAAALILTTMSVTLISFTRIRLKSAMEMLVTCCMVICGHMLFVWITAKLVANSFYRKTDLTQYQESMGQLLSFVNYKKVDKNIKAEIINHFENMWKKTKGNNIVSLLSSFSASVKEDILYDMFGRNIRNSSIFQNAPNGFFKSLLQEAKYEVYVHKGIIYRVNDIHGNIFILLKGSVQIVGPDYNKLSILSPGSAFGNLDNCEESRHTLMMVARGNVEVLKISAKYFHWVVSKYSFVRNHFRKLTAINVDYLPNTLPQKYIPLVTEKEGEFGKAKGDYMRGCSCFMRIYDTNKYIRFLHIAIIFLSCFCGYHLEVYQLATYEDNAVYIGVLYTLDLLYLLKIYLHFHTTFDDIFGLPVRERHRIARRYIHRRFGFYFDLAAAVPVEIIALLFLSQKYFFIMFTWFRKNRLIRIIVCLRAIRRNQNKLNVNIRVMKVYYMAIWITIIIQTMAALLLGFKILKEAQVMLDQTDFQMLMKAYQVIIHTASGAALVNLHVMFNMYTAINSIILMLVCRFCVALFISETCSILENINQNKRRYQANALEHKQFMKEYDVSVPLMKRVSEYFNLLWIHHRGVQCPYLLKESPYYLREAILNALYGFHLRKHPLLKHCHTDLLRQMAACFDVMIFFPGNFVTYTGDIDGYMYFIHKGEVRALMEDSLYTETVVDVLVTGSWFGLDQGLYVNCGHDYSYKVTKKSVVIGLNRKKWFHLLKFFPASKRVLFELRDEYVVK